MRTNKWIQVATALVLGAGLVACGDSGGNNNTGDALTGDVTTSDTRPSDIIVGLDTVRPDSTNPADTNGVGDSTNPADTNGVGDSTNPADTNGVGDSTTPTDTTVPTDSTTPTDTTVPTDSTTPTDTTVPTDSTTPTDTTVPTDTVQPTCGAITLTGELAQYQTYALYEVSGNFGFGSALPDVVSIEFYANVAGTFNLGTGSNTNYGTCDQCVVVYADYDAATGEYGATYFQSAGTLVVDAAHPPGGAEIAVTLSNLGFTEVTIDTTTYTSTPVAGGACYTGVGPFALATAAPPVCTPSCTGRVCGPDGCGGTCGAGCATGTCKLDGSACEATATCFPLTLGGPTAELIQAGAFGVDVTSKGIGAVTLLDAFQMEFYTAATGAFDLGAGLNTNYKTCEQCVRLFVDSDGAVPRQFFQSAGTMTVDATSVYSTGPFKANFTSVQLVEVTVATDYTSTPVPGGACISLTVNPALELAP